MKKAFLPVLLLATLSGFSQKVSNQLSFQKGQRLEVTTNINNKAEMMMGETTGNVVTTDVYEVKDAATGATVLEKSIKGVKLNFNLMGQDKSFDSDKKEDLEGSMGAPIKTAMATKTEFTVDAAGTVTAVKPAVAKKKGDEATPDVMGMMMNQMNPGSGTLKTGDASIFKVLPNREIVKGDTWEEVIKTETVQSKTNYTVKDITATDVLLDYTGAGSFTTKQEMMGMSVDIKGTNKSTGTVTVDRKTGLMKQKTAIVSTDSSMNIAGQDMQTTAKSTMVTTVKTVQ